MFGCGEPRLSRLSVNLRPRADRPCRWPGLISAVRKRHRSKGLSMERSLKIALGSFGISLLVLAIKYAAYLITGSVALYSDALESIINVATAVAVIPAIWIASRPPDPHHPSPPPNPKSLPSLLSSV